MEDLFTSGLVELTLDANGDAILQSQDSIPEEEWMDALASLDTSGRPHPKAQSSPAREEDEPPICMATDELKPHTHRAAATATHVVRAREHVQTLPVRRTHVEGRQLTRRTTTRQGRAEESLGMSRAMAARRRYQQATKSRPLPIPVPHAANPLTHQIPARMRWAQQVTLPLPLPSNTLEARYRIQTPWGEPFPFMLPRWATFWHTGTNRRDSKGCKRGGSKAKHYDLCKLLWLEGFPASTFPSLSPPNKRC